jgi:mono/diheme cytochrome c family protein
MKPSTTPRSLALGLLAAGLAAASCGPPTRAQGVASLAGSSTAGQAVYLYYCGSCHGSDGKGSLSSNGVSLAARVKVLPADAFLTRIIDGVPGTEMTGFPGFSDQRLADVYAYVATVLATP